MVEISKEYGIICSKTSFIGVEERTASEKNDGRVELRRIPVMIPAGRDFMKSSVGSGIFAQCLNLFSRSPAVRAAAPVSKILYNVSEDIDCCYSELTRRSIPSGAGVVPKSEMELPIMPAAPASKEDRVVEILVFAGSDGLFKRSERLLELIGASEDDLAARLAMAPAGLASAVREKFAMSMLVKAYLENNCQPEKDLWSAIIEKGWRKLQSLSAGSLSA